MISPQRFSEGGQTAGLQGNAYGRVDAPLLFYREFRKRLEEIGFEAHPLDNCLFFLRNPENRNQLDGILGTHVDDGIGGGNKRFELALEKLQKTLPFGSREYSRFKFTGLDIEQLPATQSNYVRVNMFTKFPPSIFQNHAVQKLQVTLLHKNFIS